MIATTAVTSSSPQGAADKSKETGFNTLGKDDFLKLLISQIQYQDPLNPMDSTEFTSQLAQFSQLEQLTQANGNLEELMKYQASINNAQAISLIGKDIKVEGDTVELKEGTPVKLGYTLGEDAVSVAVYIKNEEGNQVASLVGGQQKAGFNEMVWDGKDNEGNQLAPGNYTFQVVAKDMDGNDINVTTFVFGRVKGVEFVNGKPFLSTDYGRYALGDVVSVRLPEVEVSSQTGEETTEPSQADETGMPSDE